MIHIGTALQSIIQVLGNPAWQGASVIVSSTISIIAIRQSRQSHTHGLQPLKKSLFMSF